MDAAYRRLHASLDSAVSSITVIDKIAYLLLRLPFGAKIAADRFSVVSNMINDLALELSLDTYWDPDSLKSNSYEFIENLPTKVLEDNIPFGQAEELFISMPSQDIAFENYIDDLIGIALDSPRNRKCLLHAVPLTLHATFRPVIVKDPIKRDNIINWLISDPY